MDPSGGNYFNQSYYDNIPANTVNWALLAQQWIHQGGQPRQPQPPPSWGHPAQQMPQHGGRFAMNAGPRHQLGPMFNPNYGHPPPPPPPPPPLQYSMQPRYDFFQAPMPSNPIRHDRYPPPPPPQHPPYHVNSAAPEPLFPAAANTPLFPPANVASNETHEWTQTPPPPPPAPAWIKTDRNDQKKLLQEDIPTIDSAERKKLPNWILEGLDQMEKAKRRREEVERQKKESEKRIHDDDRKRPLCESSDEDERPPPRRKFEEYRRITDDEKSKLKSQSVKEILIKLLLDVTDLIIDKAADDAVNIVRSKKSVKAVVNKNTAALASLAALGGSSSEEEDNDGDDAIGAKPALLGQTNSGDKLDFVNDKARSESQESSSLSNKRRSRTRSRSPRSLSKERDRSGSRSSSSGYHNRHHQRSNHDDRQYSNNNHYHRSSHHRSHHHSRD